MPPAIVALCGDKLAEPGQNWNAAGAITDPTLPAKRLIWAAIGGDYYVVHYERGGIAHTFHLLVAKLSKGEPKPKLVWSAVGVPFKNYTGFLDALRTGKLDDHLDWHWAGDGDFQGGSTSPKSMRKNRRRRKYWAAEPHQLSTR